MRSTQIGFALETALRGQEGAAEREFWGAFHNQRGDITEAQFRSFLQAVGRPLTWRLWDIVLDEVESRAL